MGIGSVRKEIQFPLRTARLGTHTPRAGLQAPPSGLGHRLVQFTSEWRQTFGESLYNSPKQLDVRHC